MLEETAHRNPRRSDCGGSGQASLIIMGCCARAESGTTTWDPPGYISTRLFQLDRRACGFELLLDLLGFVLVHAFLDRLRRALDQVLGLLQAEAGDRTYLFDHVDLLGTCGGQNDVEFGLLLGNHRRS